MTVVEIWKTYKDRRGHWAYCSLHTTAYYDSTYSIHCQKSLYGYDLPRMC